MSKSAEIEQRIMRLLEFIKAYKARRGGGNHPPSYTVIADRLGYTSKSKINGDISLLVERGLIVHGGRNEMASSIAVEGERYIPPFQTKIESFPLSADAVFIDAAAAASLGEPLERLRHHRGIMGVKFFHIVITTVSNEYARFIAAEARPDLVMRRVSANLIDQKVDELQSSSPVFVGSPYCYLIDQAVEAGYVYLYDSGFWRI